MEWYRTGRAALVLVFVAISAAACASTGSEDGVRRDPDLISEMEIRQLDVSTAYDVVQRLRPRWLNAARRAPTSLRGSSRVVAVLNESVMGGFEALRNIGAEDILEIEYLDNAQAVARLRGLGSGHVGAAIVVRTYAGNN